MAKLPVLQDGTRQITWLCEIPLQIQGIGSSPAPAESPVPHDRVHWWALLWLHLTGLPVPWRKMPWAGEKGKNSPWSFAFSHGGCLCTVEGCRTGQSVPVTSGKWEVLLQGWFPQPSVSGGCSSLPHVFAQLPIDAEHCLKQKGKKKELMLKIQSRNEGGKNNHCTRVLPHLLGLSLLLLPWQRKSPVCRGS